MTPDIVLVMTAPPAVLGVIWIAAIVRAAERAARLATASAAERPAPYVPPPVTAQYVDQEFAVLMWRFDRPELNP
ncbi:hypothetical protein [Streptomyces sp. CB03911]|uniref:hypothetical protein n=1 Tax=Streptomyces sp. CB03911 TaxID=1804758 RepID=UPI00093BDC90|nr:hypothetical protein [Streptomyces sp. CB03911]OKI22228.1 hypothetical protein A6A07_34710 [Streptomyces sp. CB03911]